MTPNQNDSGAPGQDILFSFAALRQNASLMDCLISMQLDAGIDELTAEANAEECMAAVSVWDGIHERISDNAMAVMEAFFTDLARLEYSERVNALQKLLFGLTAWDDPDTAQLLEAGAPIDQLFWEHQQLQQKSGAQHTAQELEDKIRDALSGYRLSPMCMRALTLKMRLGNGYLASAEALSESGRNLKCLMTMELWLKNRDKLSMTEAAAQAAASAETQAVEDALQRGYITREAAKLILIAIGIALVIFGIVLMAQSLPVVAEAAAGIAKAAESPFHIFKTFMETETAPFVGMKSRALTRQAKGGLMVLGGGAMALLSGKGAEAAGRTAEQFGCLTRESGKVSDCLESLASDAEQPGETVYASYPEDLHISSVDLEDAEDDMLIF